MAGSCQIAVADEIFDRLSPDGAAGRPGRGFHSTRSKGPNVQLAKQVQQMLLPQHWPVQGELECHGIYRPSEAVGGDYCDVFQCEEGRTALVVADVSGHGLPAALLMASLQASFRSRERCAFSALEKLLRSVNDCFYESSLPTFYATLFIGVVELKKERLRYVNCAHQSALLLSSGGSGEWLESTAGAVGMFPGFECTVCESRFAAGDTLVACTDGILEAANDASQEYGTERFEAAVRQAAELPVSRVTAAVMADALRFSGGAQVDDMTVLAAKARTGNGGLELHASAPIFAQTST